MQPVRRAGGAGGGDRRSQALFNNSPVTQPKWALIESARPGQRRWVEREGVRAAGSQAGERAAGANVRLSLNNELRLTSNALNRGSLGNDVIAILLPC